MDMCLYDGAMMLAFVKRKAVVVDICDVASADLVGLQPLSARGRREPGAAAASLSLDAVFRVPMVATLGGVDAVHSGTSFALAGNSSTPKRPRPAREVNLGAEVRQLPGQTTIDTARRASKCGSSAGRRRAFTVSAVEDN
jgi:hypothetical protein